MYLVVYHVQLGNTSLKVKASQHPTKSESNQLLALKLAKASGLCRPLAQPISTIMLSRLRAPPTPTPIVAGSCVAAIGTGAAGDTGFAAGTPALAARPPPMKGFDEVFDAVNGTDTLR